MKTSIAILVALVLALSGCGGDDAATGSGEKNAGSTTVSNPDSYFPTVSYPGGKGKRTEPVVKPWDQPAPKELLVRDAKVGTGPVARRGDEVTIWYIGFQYNTGKIASTGWVPPASPTTINPLGAGRTFAAMEEGIEGMRVGGRREMLVPEDRGVGEVPLLMIVELVGVKPKASPGG